MNHPCLSTSLPEEPDQTTTRIIAILDEYLSGLEHGLPKDAERLLAQHPDLADVLRPHLEQLDLLHEITPSKDDADGSATFLSAGEAEPAVTNITTTAQDDSIGRLGDFRLVREIGRGGMGIVYEAEQISLGRKVALKVLPFAGVLDRRQLERFQNEARMAAQLHHSHIVPVFGVGAERGVHYYAMQMIKGCNLAAIITQRRVAFGMASDKTEAPIGMDKTEAPTWRPRPAADTDVEAQAGTSTVSNLEEKSYFRAVAIFGVQAAQALEYAHGEGLVHRDIKPANLLLDEEGHLWVTDFGLARYRNDTGLTMSGDILGTLRYMSPEQALGKHVQWDGRTDLYSLGVTLYELLGLTPAYDGNREDVLRRVASEDPVPLRAICPAVPVELETVIHKAMGKDPEDRYASGAAMAEDLQRFLDDRPILAKRPHVLERLARWTRRHKTLMWAMLLGSLLAAAGLAVSTLLIWRQMEEINRAYENEAALKLEADRQKQEIDLAYRKEAALKNETEESFQWARKAVNEMYTQVAEKWLAREPLMEKVHLEFLEKALAFYEKFAERPGTGAEFQRERALAYRRVGDIQRIMGRLQPSIQAYEKSLAVLAGLPPECKVEANVQLELARVWNNKAASLKQSGKHQAAEEGYHKALEIRQNLDAAVPERRTTLGETHYNLAHLWEDSGRTADAEKGFAQAVLIYGKLCEENPDDMNMAFTMAHAARHLGSLLELRGEMKEGEKHLRLAVEIFRKITSKESRNPEVQISLAEAVHDLGNLLQYSNRRTAAEPLLKEAIGLLNPMMAGFGDKPRIRRQLATAHNSLGWLLRCTGRPDGAQKSYEEAIRLTRDLVKHFPGTAAHHSGLGAQLNNLSELHRSENRISQALESILEAIEQQKDAVRLNPKRGKYAKHLVTHYVNLAKVQARLGDYVKAQEAAAEIALVRPEDYYGHYRAALTYVSIVVESKKSVTGRPVSSVELYECMEHAKQYLQEAARRAEGNAKALDALAWYLATTGTTKLRDGLLAASLSAKATELEPGNASFWNTRLVASFRAGEFAAAVSASERLKELGVPPSRGAGFALAMAHFRLDDPARAMTCYDDALAQYRAATSPSLDAQRLAQEAAQLLGRPKPP